MCSNPPNHICTSARVTGSFGLHCLAYRQQQQPQWVLEIKRSAVVVVVVAVCGVDVYDVSAAREFVLISTGKK